jgi:hypothetical protein
MQLQHIGSNMTEVTTDTLRVLFSYSTPVAAYSLTAGQFYKTSRKWSVTTTKHINKWLDGAGALEQPQEFFEALL